MSGNNADVEFPPRYEPLEQLGKGGCGEVWSARDRVTEATVALKLLRPGADEAEVLALVREATALSGVEGLGVPRVFHFGRLSQSNRAYLVRELVEGQSLTDLLAASEPGKQGPKQYFAAIVEAADLLTRLHRARLLHGDIKPANIIVGSDGRATLVDLGLAAHWQEGGAKPEGLTPRYAAPELFAGEPLTPRAEVYALGASTSEVLRLVADQVDPKQRHAIEAVIERATTEQPAERYPSTDEFAEALSRAADLQSRPHFTVDRAWSIVGLDQPSTDLLTRVRSLEPSGGLVVVGPKGSGRSTLLRRISWSLGVAGDAVGFIEAQTVRTKATSSATGSDSSIIEGAPNGSKYSLHAAVADMLKGRQPTELTLIVDDADCLDAEQLARLDELRSAGSRLVMVAAGSEDSTKFPGPTFALFEVAPLNDQTATELVGRMIPSLGKSLVAHLVKQTGGWPGAIRTAVERLEGVPVVSVADVDRLLGQASPRPAGEADPTEIHQLLDCGRLDDAAEALEAFRHDRSLNIALARAKLATGRGQTSEAIAELQSIEAAAKNPENADYVAVWHHQMAKALLRAGRYEETENHANLALTHLGASLLSEVGSADPSSAQVAEHDAQLSSKVGALAADALNLCGLAQSLLARNAEAVGTLRRSVNVARAVSDPRTLSEALGSLAFAQQRDDQLDDAFAAYQEALGVAEKAGHAGTVASIRLNLAGIAKTRGDIATALAHLEGAVDMGRRSGRRATERQALLNLANMELYLGRRARARASIETLAKQRAQLGKVAQAQLFSLEAESAALAEDYETAEVACLRCAEAYDGLGRHIDAAEALLERVVILARTSPTTAEQLAPELAKAEEKLGDSGAHRALLAVAQGYVAMLSRKPEQALSSFEKAIVAGRESGQREWVWRAQESAAELRRAAGDETGALACLQAASALLDEIATELPPDLREVYWNDPRRSKLRQSSQPAVKRRVISTDFPPPPGEDVLTAATQLGGAVSQDRLARVLQINREIAGEHDLDRLLEMVTDHAIALLYAERGFVLLRSRSGEDQLSVHAARDRHGEKQHARFSRSIAERVVQSGEPFVALNAPDDERVSDYVSVHQLMLKSVACVPIRARTSRVIGALYLETRRRSAALFKDELSTLTAFADQVAIAIETARLVSENQQRAKQLETTNRELETARAKLEELLGRRTEQLVSTRRNLRTARAALRRHFGYQGIVGASAAMRKVYAIIDRVKDADVPVLIFGDSGTGKEVIARAIHDAGPRAKQRMVGVNCGAIPEQLLESELFGHVRGAFTGADRDKKGLFRELSNGTILLDEIGEMPPKMQAGLLRVLQEKVVRPVGGTREEAVHTRVIAATHRNLSEMVANGSFREDLFYRLNVISIHVPPLRQRTDDLPLLIDHFLRRFAARYHRERRTVSRDALKRLSAFSWPGNVRQLENVLLNAWILSDREELQPDDFELPEPPPPSQSQVRSTVPPESLDMRTQQEKERILDALAACNWNRARAAELIDMPRRTFYRRLKKYKIQ